VLIDKAEIERVKAATDLVALVESRGVTLERKGRQMVGLCPFHPDREASLFVDPRKRVWNCLGACKEGGDAYRFVMKADEVDFPEAHRRLTGDARRPAAPEQAEASAGDLQWLARYAEHCHRRLLESPEAQGYARSRGISTEAMTVLRLGYADGSVGKVLSPEGRGALRRVGVLTGSWRELMRGCLVFPLLSGAGGHAVSLYGRHTEHRQHLYLPGERRGVFNPAGARETDEVVLVEAVVDAAALWSLGLRNVVPIYGTTGLTDEIVAHLAACRVGRVAVMLDADEAGEEAARRVAARLEGRGMTARVVEIGAKDGAEYVASGGTLDGLRALMAEPPKAEREQAPEAAVADDGALVYDVDGRRYRVRGLSPVGLDRLKVTLRASANGNGREAAPGFHLDTLDLYQARARAQFAVAAAKLCGVPEPQTERDLLTLVERLEAERLRMRRSGGEERSAPMTAEEREAALSYLRAPDLCASIVADFRASGLEGERATVLVAYLSAISRKLAEPLSILVVARSGAGKSALQDALCAMTPPEDTVRVTRLTGQALFYKDPDSLRRKLLSIAEDEGAAQAVYSLRTLASDQRLAIAATRTDPQTGRLHTEHYEVSGPVSIAITTTSPEAFDEETRSRFVQLTMDESVEQTRAILARQRRRYTLEGVMERARSERLHRLHHNVQRLLRPVEVVNPFVEELTYPEDRLLHRREQLKYLRLIASIAFLHQHQREIKRRVEDGVEVEYVEVEVSDIALANELAREVLSRSLDELAPPVRGMYEAIRAACAARAEAIGCRSGEIQLSRRDIRELTGWSDWQVRTYCARLVELEYLHAVASGNGTPAVYRLAREGEETVRQLRGLTDVEELRKRLREDGAPG
jgi:DNA primase